jgi:hypothetical protein
MTISWTKIEACRASFYADCAGRRLLVRQTVRSHCAFGKIGLEYQASIGGVRIGEFPSVDLAQAAAIARAQTKTAPRNMRGRDVVGVGLSLDY